MCLAEHVVKGWPMGRICMCLAAHVVKGWPMGRIRMHLVEHVASAELSLADNHPLCH